MNAPAGQPQRAAIIGTGLVGASWAVVFARAGWQVALYDHAAGMAAIALQRIGANLEELARRELLTEPASAVWGRIESRPTLEAALLGAHWIQESIAERLQDKRDLFARLDAVAGVDAWLASSTSAFATSVFAESLAGRARCFVAHPVNPPHLVPLVEVSGAPFTSPAVIEGAVLTLRALGQSPVVLRREVHGFLLNRLQWALLAEAYRLVASGVASVDDLDTVVRDGLGRRWAFMGPFEVGDLNAPAGLRDYFERFGPTIERIAAEGAAAPLQLSTPAIWGMHAARRERLADSDRAERVAWRDRRLMELAQLLARQGSEDV